MCMLLTRFSLGQSGRLLDVIVALRSVKAGKAAGLRVLQAATQPCNAITIPPSLLHCSNGELAAWR